MAKLNHYYYTKYIYIHKIHVNMSMCNTVFSWSATYFQKRYILKFATDGAVLSKTKNAVQGKIKLIPAHVHGKVLDNNSILSYLQKEITLYY